MRTIVSGSNAPGFMKEWIDIAAAPQRSKTRATTAPQIGQAGGARQAQMQVAV